MRHIQGEVPWYMLFANDVVLGDEIRNSLFPFLSLPDLACSFGMLCFVSCVYLSNKSEIHERLWVYDKFLRIAYVGNEHLHFLAKKIWFA